MKICNLLVVLLILACNTAVAQQFFNGTVNTTSAINRTGSVGIGNVLFRSSSGIQVLEHTYPTGDFYIRSVAYQVQNDEGNLILNDIGGFVGIGTSKPKEMLSVNGKIRAQEIKVETTNWPDYVFNAGYQLPSLKETAEFIEKHKHLPGVPKAAEVEQDGLSLGEMNKILMQKVEELTLHLIEKDNEIKKQNETIQGVLEQMEQLKNLLTK
ncbi:hypothetical protein [Sphingobacterium siyangense]